MVRYLLIVTILLVIGCSSSSNSTDTHSRTLPDLKSRKEFAARYFKFPTEVEELSFHIVYHDNSGGLAPGPSDWDIQILAKVKNENLAQWHSKMPPASDNLDLEWLKDLGETPAESPKLYGTEHNLTAVFQDSGVVARRLYTD